MHRDILMDYVHACLNRALMVDICSGTATVLLLYIFDCKLLCNNHFFNPENPGTWAQTITGFGIEKSGRDPGIAIAIYLCSTSLSLILLHVL